MFFLRSGGFVFLDRVNGELAMSRALGDYQYKRNDDLSPAEQMVSCYPDIAVHKRGDTDRLLVLACDGVWDVMTNCEAISYLQDIVFKEDKTATSETMADALVQIALAAGSTDNISAVVAKLRGEEWNVMMIHARM
jgi:serine/threonine protein phosphatase PrpC